MEELTRIIEMFENGEYRYNNSPLFRKCIDSLYHGADSHVILDQVIQIADNAQKEHSDHMKNNCSLLFLKQHKLTP